MSENMFATAEDISQLIHQIVGAGSTCWIGGTGDSEFWTAEAAHRGEQRLIEIRVDATGRTVWRPCGYIAAAPQELAW